MCCSVLQDVAVCDALCDAVCVAVCVAECVVERSACCSILQYLAVFCSMLQCVSVRCRALALNVEGCDVLQCVAVYDAVRYSVMLFLGTQTGSEEIWPSGRNAKHSI